MKYAEKYGVSHASRKYNKSRSYIYFWKQCWDGSAATPATRKACSASCTKWGCFRLKSQKAYKPKLYEQMSHPRERVQVNVKVMPRKCLTDSKLRLYQHTAIDRVTRLRFLAAYPEQSTYSSAEADKMISAPRHQGECIQTDNGFEFTNRFSASKRDLQTLFKKSCGAWPPT